MGLMMMTRFLRLTGAAVLGASLAACGGSSEQTLLDRINDNQALSDRVGAMTRSGPRVVDNTTGRARFSGAAAIVAGTEFNATVLIGDANVNVDFNGPTNVSGSITNVEGSAGVNLNMTGTGRLDDYDGRLNLSNGSVGGGNQLSVDYAGTLRGNGDVLDVDGTMNGIFLGNPQIRALGLYGEDLGTLNGNLTVVGVEVIAERD